MEAILVLNAGSSSLKFQTFAPGPAGPRRLIRGQIDGIGLRPRFRARGEGCDETADLGPADIPDLPAAIAHLWRWLGAHGADRLLAVGHRVVHGGPDHAAPVLIDDAVLDRLTALTSLAPLHQPGNLAPIRLIRDAAPHLPQVACFDTAFHRGHPDVADAYALPQELRDAGLRRYGFHGLSYAYVASELARIAPDLASGRVIVAHLGNGASLCALKAGRSIESTMGFTALDGLVMGTRPGQIDPGAVLWLIAERGMTAADVSDLLYRRSGLLGLSGISSDMRDLLSSRDPRAAFALDCFVHRAALQAGAMAAALQGADALVFTAGIGENSPAIRAAIAGRLGWLGAGIDPAANAANATEIGAAHAPLRLFVLPTDEELMIAREVTRLIGGGAPAG
jgi:acetate kinase